MIYKNGLIRLLEEMVDKAFDECEEHTIRGCMEIVKKMPTVDAVVVVRCKDCKHFTEGMAIGMCKRINDKPSLPVPYNHFCSFAERREENAAD